MTVILMKLQIMRETEPKLSSSCHQTKVLALGPDFIQMRCWPKGSHVNAQTTQDYGYWPELSLRLEVLKIWYQYIVSTGFTKIKQTKTKTYKVTTFGGLNYLISFSA